MKPLQIGKRLLDPIRRVRKVDVTFFTRATFSAAGVFTSFTRTFVKRILSNAGPSTPRYA